MRRINSEREQGLYFWMTWAMLWVVVFMLGVSVILMQDIRILLQEQNRLMAASVDTVTDTTPSRAPGDDIHSVIPRTVVVTAYLARPGDKTAIAENPEPGWTCAVSRDLVDWLGGKVWIEGVGVRYVSDLTHQRFQKRVDVLVGKPREVASIGNEERRVIFLGKG